MIEKIHWLGHASFRIDSEITIYIETSKHPDENESKSKFPIGAIFLNPPSPTEESVETVSFSPLATLKVLATRRSLAESLIRADRLRRMDLLFSVEGQAPNEFRVTVPKSGVELTGTNSFNFLNYVVVILLSILSGFLFGLIILSVSTSYIISRKINLSVNLIKIGMTQLNEGNLNHKIPVITEDELGELAANFNTMTESLKNYQVEREQLLMEHMEQERMKNEFAAARLLQTSLLPIKAPVHPGMDITGMCHAADIVGGDYFDYIDLADGSLGFAIGDVSGHSMSAGILMSMAKSCILNQLRISAGVEEVIWSLNDMIYSTFKRKRIMTFLYAIFSPDGRFFKFTSAGHHFPYLFRQSTHTLMELECVSYPLGVREKLNIKIREMDLIPGDVLVFYTDGIVETRNPEGEILGFERFEHAIVRLAHQPVQQIMEGLLAMAGEFRKTEPEVDDTTLVIIKIREDPAA